jgi:hypothetical protein
MPSYVKFVCYKNSFVIGHICVCAVLQQILCEAFFFQAAMLDYFKVQLVFHAKAIEFYSKCFESMSMVDEERDLQVMPRLSTCTGSI